MATPNLGITELSASQADKTTRVNQMVRDLEGALTNWLTVVMTDAADYNLTTAEAGLNMLFDATGALTSPWNITVPDAIVKLHLARDSTTGTQTVTYKTVTGTGIALTSSWQLLYSDGTNVIAIM
jgi:hypothetical protein